MRAITTSYIHTHVLLCTDIFRSTELGNSCSFSNGGINTYERGTCLVICACLYIPIPSISTKLPAGTRLTSTLYLSTKNEQSNYMGVACGCGHTYLASDTQSLPTCETLESSSSSNVKFSPSTRTCSPAYTITKSCDSHVTYYHHIAHMFR